MKNIRHKNSGAASLITVIFVSIILSIVVVGFVRVAINESRQSTDNDLTNRALYAAESGLEDAKRALRDFFRGNLPSGLQGDVCDSPYGTSSQELSAATEFDTEYTCMLIDATPPNYEAELGVGETTQVELQSDGDVPFDKVIVEWHLNATVGQGGNGQNPPLRNSGDSDLPTTANWRSGGSLYPAMLRTYLFSYPDSGISRGGLNGSDVVAFLNPTNVNPIGEIDYDGGARSTLGVVAASCDTSNSYVCRHEINVNGGEVGDPNHVLRLTGLYTGTNVRVSLLSAGNPVDLAGSQALIDITGRAGDVFRRVETRVDISADFGDLIPDFGILSADDICKNMTLSDDISDFSANACTP